MTVPLHDLPTRNASCRNASRRNTSRGACILAVGLALFVALALAPGCSGRRAEPPQARRQGPVAFPVEVESVTVQNVDYVVRVVGSLEAFETLQVTSRVAGVVERVRFREGDAVVTNQVLVEIEPRRFKLALDAERAALAKAKAARADALAGLERRQSAVQKTPGLIPGEEVATWKTRVATAEAEVAAAEAALGAADLNLRDAFVRAPVKGIIETRNIQTGQYVQPGTVLATLVQRDPLLLRFSVPPEAATSLTRSQRVAFTVGETEESYAAKITHIAQVADSSTRQVPIAAEVERSSSPALRPGAFARVTARLGERERQLAALGESAPTGQPTIPESAIRPSEKGFIAFVIKDGKAEERRLSLGLRTSDGRVEVKEGLVPGERLVIRGAEALRDGASVKVADSAPKGS